MILLGRWSTGTGNLGCGGFSFVGTFIEERLNQNLVEAADVSLTLSLGRGGIETDLTSLLFL